MITFWNFNQGLNHISSWAPNAWTQVTCPNDKDKEFLINMLGAPDYFLSDIADADETARYDYDEGWLMIILRIPYMKNTASRTPYTTVPFGILINGDKIVTICYQETSMMPDFISHQIKRGLGFIDSTDMVFRIFLSSSVWYLKYLKQVNSLIERAKMHLDDTHINNKDLVGLSRLQDSLTYFATSIRDNATLLSKLKYKLPVDELDAELIDDVNIEMNQARETTGIYIDILNSTMDTYANIINNNMNAVMRILTSLNMIIMFPTLITSMFGMNLINGMEIWKWGFPLAILFCIISTAISLLWFKHKNWM